MGNLRIAHSYALTGVRASMNLANGELLNCTYYQQYFISNLRQYRGNQISSKLKVGSVETIRNCFFIFLRDASTGIYDIVNSGRSILYPRLCLSAQKGTVWLS